MLISNTHTSKSSLGLQDPNLFRQQCYVGGRWLGEAKTPIYNPQDQSVLGHVPHFGPEETRDAIRSAETALHGWKAFSAKERSDALTRWADLCLEHQLDLARI